MEKTALILVLICSMIWLIKYVMEEISTKKTHDKFMKDLKEYDKKSKK